jgi:hypothetical protein
MKMTGMMNFLESKRAQVIVGNLIWLLVFLFVSTIIFLIIKSFFNFSFEITYLQVCAGHIIVRMLRAELPVDTIPIWIQGRYLNDIDKEIDKLDKELKKLDL